ncbi:hypothetical protein RGU70_10775 [Herbaspirillum sp. RTI4]|uniref:hypothetical protein n=1 Tax=Herbaspirillum sp. RTI4 TaxID=3048640 RepID=UPI002AB3648B|nr:hypothetical protein [Herbaspirillum sp. RTI4]MDY7578803.1 hypothetical protein [Herbaspirillum sp. RTI4]MEA9983428.1 hypothetical protein [Herbaspirillum sp. RTI4]
MTLITLPKITLLTTLILAAYAMSKESCAQELSAPEEQATIDPRFVPNVTPPAKTSSAETFANSPGIPGALVQESVRGDHVAQLPIPAQIDQAHDEESVPLNTLPHIGVRASPKETIVQREIQFLPFAKTLATGNRIEVQLEKQNIVADGLSGIRLKIMTQDAAGQAITTPILVRLETTLGRFRLADGKEASIASIVVTGGVNTLQLMSSLIPGTANIHISSGDVVASGKLHFLAEQRPLLAVGIIDVSHSIGRSDKDSNAASVVNPGFEDNFLDWSDGDGSTYTITSNRMAGFIKGTIFDDYLLTASYDNKKINNNKYFSDIDPNEYYPNYGDTSVIQYDARSTSKLYARVDQGKSYLMYGDYTTNDGNLSRRLGSYTRTLNGGKGYFENDQFSVLYFAARTGYTKQVNEQPALGLSGPYTIANSAQAVLNSEQVTLVTRDRFQPSIVLHTVAMTRYVDYDFEPFSGRIIFRKPVPSVDENLNPISIRIAYEVDKQNANQHWVAGIDGAYRINSTLTVEGRYAKDENPLIPNNLKGATGQINLGKDTQIVVDYATSQGSETLPVSGASLNQIPGSGASAANLSDLSGDAKSIAFTHEDESLKAHFLATKVDAGFSNPSANVTPGRKEEVGNAEYKINDDTAIVTRGRHTSDTLSGGYQTAGSAGVRKQLTPALQIEAGINHVDENYSTSLGSGLGGNGFRYVSGSGALDPNSGSKNLLSDPSALQCTGVKDCTVVNKYDSAYLNAKYQITPAWWVSADAEQAINGNSGQRASVGTEYTISTLGRAYGRYEWTDGLSEGFGLGDNMGASKRAVVGLDTSYMHGGNVFGEYRAGGISANDNTTATGVRNTFELTPNLVATGSYERQLYRSQSLGMQTANAVTSGLDYVGDPMWRAGGRLEYRISNTQQDWLSTMQVTHKLDQSWSWLARDVVLKSRPLGSDNSLRNNQNRFQLGLAYRDMETNHLNALLRYENNINVSGPSDDRTDSRNNVLAAGANYRADPKWTYSVSTAWKSQTDRLSGVSSSFNAALISGRTMYDINDRWDAGILVSHAWGGGVRDSGYGVEAGYQLIKNLWASVGYVTGRYADSEMFATNSSWRAVYFRLRFKFDENVFNRS